MQEPDLMDMTMFARVAEAGGFRAAAARTGISASSLSDAVQRLEKAAGIRLLTRTTRNVMPTQAGQLLLDRVRPALADLASAFDGLTDEDEAAGTLMLDVPGIVARYIMPPIITEFLKLHPRMRVELSVIDGLADIMAAGNVAGVRYEENMADDMMTVPIGPRLQRFVGVASPAYLEKRGSPTHPKDLADHDLIAHMYPNRRVPQWEFERGDEKFRIRPKGRLVTGSSDVQVAAAVGGLGILFAFQEFVRDHIERGELATILEDWPQEFNGPFLYYPRSHRRDPPLVAFVAFLKRQSIRL